MVESMDAERLFAEHHAALVRYLTRYTGDREAAADAAQETYLRLLARPPLHDRNLRAWLFTVATNVARDGYRRAQLARLAEPLEWLAPQAAAVQPDAALEEAERRRLVRGLLATLSPKDRAALLLRGQGFRHREIAAAVGTTTKSVGTIIARALRKLARHLGPELEDLL